MSDGEVTVLQIDERAPNDRVYRREIRRVTQQETNALIGDNPIGHNGDERHAAISKRVLGEPLRLVDPDDA